MKRGKPICDWCAIGGGKLIAITTGPAAGMKFCTRCKGDHPATAVWFRPDKRRRDGLLPWCRNCERERQREYHEANRERRREYNRRWRERNRDSPEYRERYQRDGERIREHQREYRERNRDRLNETPAHCSWRAMKDRTLNPNNISYSNYGGRGITLCQRWRDSFENFLADMGERPAGMTLDRIDNDGNYEPGNCRWATPSQQNANRRQAKRQREREKLAS